MTPLLLRTALAAAVLALATAPVPAQTNVIMARDQALEVAHDCLLLRWYCGPQNIYTNIQNATCPYSSPGWQIGISYKWGGYDTRDSFYNAVVTNGGYAGDVNSAAIVSGIFGQDCSGFGSRVVRSSRFTTSSYPNVSTLMTYETIGPGDIMNLAGSHMRVFEKYTGTNLTMQIENTAGVSPGRVVRRVLSTNTSYQPRKYNLIVAWPSIVRATALGGDSATIEFLGGATTGFRIYRSTNLVNWTVVVNESTLGPTAQVATVSGLSNGQIYYFRVTAVNGATETAPSAVFPLLKQSTGARKALLVQGFDRWIRKSESGGLPHAFLTSYVAPLAALGYAVDSIDNLRITDGTINLLSYDAVYWQLGDESTADETFNHQEQLRAQTYLEGGGKLFVSGSEILWDLRPANVNDINDANFRDNYLKTTYVSDGSNGNGFAYGGAANTPFAGLSGTFDDGTKGTFRVAFPDVISATGGSEIVLRYPNNTGAGIGYKGTFGTGTVPGAVILLGFPLETVTDNAQRTGLMSATHNYFFGAASSVEDWSQY